MNPLKRLARVSTDIVMLVNGQRRVSDKTRRALVPSKLRTELVDAAKRAAERGLVVANLSEISARVGGGRLVINRQGAWLADLSAGDLAVLPARSDRSILGLAPSRHAAWHRLIYESTEAAAVLLCQPASALLAAGLNRSPDPADLVGDLMVVEPQDRTIKAALEGRSALLIRGHGLLVWGPSPMAAVGLAETANAWCRASIGAERLPGSTQLEDEESGDHLRSGLVLGGGEQPHTQIR